jgi:hypothetical protein
LGVTAPVPAALLAERQPRSVGGEHVSHKADVSHRRSERSGGRFGSGLRSPASAAPETVDHGSVTFPAQEFNDSDVRAADGFTVHVLEHEKLMFNVRLDDSGQFAALFAHHDISFQISANGRTILESDHYNNLFSPDGTSFATGNEAHILGEHGVVLLDAGRIVFDADGNPTFVAGRHPQVLGATFCAALMP